MLRTSPCALRSACTTSDEALQAVSCKALQLILQFWPWGLLCERGSQHPVSPPPFLFNYAMTNSSFSTISAPALLMVFTGSSIINGFCGLKPSTFLSLTGPSRKWLLLLLHCQSEGLSTRCKLRPSFPADTYEHI